MKDVINIKIKSWEKFNPRKDRASHSWFRMQNNWYDDPAMFNCNAEERYIWVTLLGVFADQHDEKFALKLSISWFAHRILVNSKKILGTLDKFQSNQLLTITGNHMVPERGHNKLLCHATNVTNERTDVSVIPDKESGGTLSASKKEDKPAQILGIWNDLCGTLPKVLKITQGRRVKINKQLKDYPDLDLWRDAVKRLADSNFCNGDNDRNWKATFDFLIKADSIAKALEGTYDNKKPKQKKDTLEDFVQL